MWIFAILNHLCLFVAYYVSLWCSSIVANYYFHVPFNLEVIWRHMTKTTQNTSFKYLHAYMLQMAYH